jgi:hypothetical protein
MEEVNDNMDRLPEGYLKHLQENKKFIEDLEKEELIEGRRTNIENIKNRIALDKRQTENARNRLINELKFGGLGKRIKEAPSDIIIIKKPLHVRLWRNILKFFKI